MSLVVDTSGEADSKYISSPEPREAESNDSTASSPNDSDDASQSDSITSEPESPELKTDLAASFEIASGSPRPGVCLRALHLAIFYFCVAVSHVVLGVRTFLARFVRGAEPVPVLERPDARLTWDVLSNAADPCQVARETLPTPPPFPTPPPEGITISFGPCANLMIYTGGVAACLQQCPNYKEVYPYLRFYGSSCGAYIAASMAADQDMMSQLSLMIAWTHKFQGRLWGLIGAYSESITAIVWSIFSNPASFERARHRLGIGTTVFRPCPELAQVYHYDSATDLVTTLLGSCYIPVAFERPQWSKRMGPLWDGGILEFAVQGDVVVSPSVQTCPDVHPREPYPRSFVFFPPPAEDAVKIFEDGYMDCLRWLQAGAPSHVSDRERLTTTCSGLKPLLIEAFGFVSEILFGKKRSFEASQEVIRTKTHQA